MPKPSRILLDSSMVPQGMLWERYARKVAHGWELADITYPADGNQGDGYVETCTAFCTLENNRAFFNTGRLVIAGNKIGGSNGRSHANARQDVNKLLASGYECIEYACGLGVKFHPFFEEAPPPELSMNKTRCARCGYLFSTHTLQVPPVGSYLKGGAVCEKCYNDVKPFPLTKIPLQPVPASQPTQLTEKSIAALLGTPGGRAIAVKALKDAGLDALEIAKQLGEVSDATNKDSLIPSRDSIAISTTPGKRPLGHDLEM